MPEFGDFWEELGMMVFAIDLLWWRLWWFNLEIYDVLLHIIRLRLILKSSLLNVDNLTVSWGASGYSPAETEMEQIFGVGAEVGTLGLSLYVLGLALGPMTLAPLSENLGGFLVLRFFAGLFSAVTIVGSPSGYFLFSFIAATKGLRSVFWALLGISGGFWLIMILVLRETRHSIILSRLHKHHRQTSKQPIPQRIKLAAGNLYQKALKRPFTFLFTEPIVQFCALYNGYLYGLSFLFNSAFVIVFGAQGHGFGTIDTGLCFLGICVGITLGPITTAIFQEPYYQRKLKRSNRKPNPEDRVMLGKVAGITFPISLFWFAWTSYSFIHFIVPILASALWGWSFYTLILMTYTYTEDSYHTFSASALAGIGLIRNIAGAGFPLFGRQMYGRLGNQGASSLLAGLACLMVPIPFLLGRFGERLRGRSRWAGVGEEGGGSEGVERREAEGKDDEV
ncbi:putative Uncharacterized transporter C36.03c [Glarea lozoyensis 74030]|uniref:Putative Uncharacterized transporter C36.03c n=1 Tax=Glarea lozoyensis (strain ATCC 74030 / MF5533) TaxID=1104152 RepID=H0ETD3_GLAL7|nr:putative Uncharacterized transporter C36.03c [Glarea lozoyensis 74030]